MTPHAKYSNPSLLTISTCLFLIAIVIVLQCYRAMYLAPAPEYIWDNVYLWDWARSFSHGDFSSFKSDSHHLMRWGDWLFPAVLIQFFSDSVFIYFLSTLIPSTLAVCVFTYICWRHAGVIAALSFIVLWYFDALLFRASFQLLPSGQGLLPLSLICLQALKVNRLQELTKLDHVVFALLLFWLYGTKETHLAFMPGVLWVLWRIGGFSAVLIQIAAFFGLYIAETVFFALIATDFPMLGRVQALLSGGQHIKIMTEDTNYVAQQTQYFDSGITMRWVKTSGVTPIIIFLGYFFALFRLSSSASSKIRKPEVRDLSYVVSVLIISFLIFSTFFVVSIFPIRLGHGLVPRYATLVLPLIYLLIVSLIAYLAHGQSKLWKLGALLPIVFLIAPAIERYSGYTTRSISLVSQAYDDFGKSLVKYDCVRAKQKSIVMNQLDLVPEEYQVLGTVSLGKMDELLVKEGRWFVVKAAPPQKCKNTFTITRNVTMRY